MAFNSLAGFQETHNRGRPIQLTNPVTDAIVSRPRPRQRGRGLCALGLANKPLGFVKTCYFI